MPLIIEFKVLRYRPSPDAEHRASNHYFEVSQPFIRKSVKFSAIEGITRKSGRWPIPGYGKTCQDIRSGNAEERMAIFSTTPSRWRSPPSFEDSWFSFFSFGILFFFKKKKNIRTATSQERLHLWSVRWSAPPDVRRRLAQECEAIW